MKLFCILVITLSLAITSCTHRKTQKVIIHKVHTPKIKSKSKVLPEEKPIKEEKVSPPSQRDRDDSTCWPFQCK